MAKKYLIISARQENFETSVSVNTLQDVPESTNQITSLPVGVKETLARQSSAIVLCEWTAFPEKETEIFSRNYRLVHPSILLLICR